MLYSAFDFDQSFPSPVYIFKLKHTNQFCLPNIKKWLFSNGCFNFCIDLIGQFLLPQIVFQTGSPLRRSIFSSMGFFSFILDDELRLCDLKNKQPDMIDDAGDQQRRQCIEHADLCCPFDRMRLSCGCRQSADAGHIEANGEDEGQTLRLGEVGG